MPMLYQVFVYRQDLTSNPCAYYIFGDNDQRVGRGGQAAEMRGEPNAIGVRTKRSPSVCYYDTDYEEHIKKIDEDFQRIRFMLQLGKTVIFPRNGIGTGLAMLHISAPRIMQHIDQIMSELEEKYHEQR